MGVVRVETYSETSLYLVYTKRIAYLKLAYGYSGETPSKQQKSNRLIWVCFLRYTFREGVVLLSPGNEIGLLHNLIIVSS